MGVREEGEGKRDAEGRNTDERAVGGGEEKALDNVTH